MTRNTSSWPTAGRGLWRPDSGQRASTLPGALRLDFLIIGAQKSASTYLQRCLASHPQLFMPLEEAPHFEDPYYDTGGIASLAAILGGVDPGVLRGVKRPDYLARPEVPARVAAHAPDAKLLVVLRDPVARAVSAYRHYVAAGEVQLSGIDDAVQRLLGTTFDADYPRAHEILEWGKYGDHLDRYRQHFPADQMLTLMQDEVTSDPTRGFSSVCAFLGVDDTFTPPRLNDRRNVGAQSPLHLRFRRTRTRVRETYLMDRANARRAIVGWPYMATLTAVDRYVFPKLPGRLDQPSEATKQALRAYYRQDVKHLQDIVHRDLRAWVRA